MPGHGGGHLDGGPSARLTACMDVAEDGTADRSLADLADSRRGWHGVQLAVLAFIGLCGVLSDADPPLSTVASRSRPACSLSPP